MNQNQPLVRTAMQKQQIGTVYDTKKWSVGTPNSAKRLNFSTKPPWWTPFQSLFFSNYCCTFLSLFHQNKQITALKSWNLLSCKIKATSVLETHTVLVFSAAYFPILHAVSWIGENTHCTALKLSCAWPTDFLYFRYY